MKQLTVTESVQLSVGIEFMFMGVDLSAYYKKKDDGYEIFLAPSNLDNNVQITLSEMVQQFKKMSGAELDEETVKKKIEADAKNSLVGENGEPVQLDWGKVGFCLKMLFLNIKSGKPEESVTEYALSLQIVADGLIPADIKIFNIHSMSFNIWNTQRQNILEHMALLDPDSF